MKYPLLLLLAVILVTVGIAAPMTLRERGGPLLGVGEWVGERGAPELAGRWTLLAFFGPEVPTCRDDAEVLQGVHESWGPRGLEVVGVTTAPRNVVRDFAHEQVVGYRMLASAGGEFESYGVELVPETFLVDPAGRIVARGLDEARVHLREHGLPHVPADAPPLVPVGDPVPADLVDGEPVRVAVADG